MYFIRQVVLRPLKKPNLHNSTSIKSETAQLFGRLRNLSDIQFGNVTAFAWMIKY